MAVVWARLLELRIQSKGQTLRQPLIGCHHFSAHNSDRPRQRGNWFSSAARTWRIFFCVGTAPLLRISDNLPSISKRLFFFALASLNFSDAHFLLRLRGASAAPGNFERRRTKVLTHTDGSNLNKVVLFSSSLLHTYGCKKSQSKYLGYKQKKDAAQLKGNDEGAMGRSQEIRRDNGSTAAACACHLCWPRANESQGGEKRLRLRLLVRACVCVSEGMFTGNCT